MTSTVGRFEPIVWIDMEMTGLDTENDLILEVACTITDENLKKIVTEDLNIVVHAPDTVLDNMDEWCLEHHGKTGLTEECRTSEIEIGEAERILLHYLQQHVGKGKCPMAGNSVYMDRIFLKKHMPKVDEYLHYRIIDISSIKELARRWNPKLVESMPPKDLVHRALSDINGSIQELEFYKKHFLIHRGT